MTALESALPWIIVPKDRIRLPSRSRQLDMQRQAEITEMNKSGSPSARIRKRKDNSQYLTSCRALEWKGRNFLAYKCSCPGFRRRWLAAAKKQGVLTKIGPVEGYLLASPPDDLELDKHVWFALKNGLLGEKFA
ncbi:MAG: hypothetical protein ACE5OZ_10355 [Candidatus Heimdallarchaeota archaeon]